MKFFGTLIRPFIALLSPEMGGAGRSGLHSVALMGSGVSLRGKLLHDGLTSAKADSSRLSQNAGRIGLFYRETERPHLFRIWPNIVFNSLVVSGVLVASLLCTAQTSSSPPKHFSPAAQSFQNKVDFLERNAHAKSVSHKPTQINADEVNAWFREGGYKLPQGVEKVIFHSQPDTIQADSTVDFDAVKEGKHNLNPLLSVFSGVHDVQVTATASTQNGQGQVNIQSVSIDGIGVPNLALEMFVNKYLKPKYPNVGLENTFQMPDRIDTATVGNDSALLTQK